ncbi:hypothetical protein FRC11_011969, partial [Ceratobasidium sp. 423]
SVGACLTATFFSLLGVSIGALNFLILAKLGHVPVAQAVVFAVMVYLLALIKAQGLKYFGFSLLAILMSFNGIYTSIMLGNGFNSNYLKEYIKSYMWGSAIVLFVNMCIFPISSERELRQLLVVSLEHVATYSHLLAKTYTLTITDEERDARARLAQTIRADFGLLTMKMAETSAEINWSRWSMDDYLVFVAKTRAVQLSFRVKQQELLGAALMCGKLHGGSSRLRLYEERKSLAQEEGRDWVRGDAEMRRRQGRISRATSVKASEVDRESSRPVSAMDIELEEGAQDEEDDPKKIRVDQMMTDARQCMVRVYSLLYAVNQFAHELSAFHEAVTSRKNRSKRIHIHMFEVLAGKVHKAERKKKERAQRVPVSTHTTQSETGDMEIDNASEVEDRELCVREALAILEQKEFVPKKTNFWQKLERAKRLLESPTSIYAGKTAAATLIFAVLIWAPTTRQWFINYGLTGGLITVVVALTPTLGQTLFTFVMQIVGSAVGYIAAIIVLEAFKDVGGYRFNPYGMACLIGLYSIPFEYLIYEKPMYFTLALLALNGTGVIVVTEWTVQQYQGRHSYDSPPYRAGKALSSLAVALAIVGTFQLVVLRNPARRQIRETTAQIVYGLLGYNTVLQAYVRATMPADSAFRAPQAALER